MTDDHCSRKTCTNIMGKSYQKSNGFLACLQFFKWETDIEKLWLNFGRIWIKFRPVFAKNLGNWSNYEHGDNSRKCSNFGKFSQRFHYMKDALWYQQWKKMLNAWCANNEVRGKIHIFIPNDGALFLNIEHTQNISISSVGERVWAQFNFFMWHHFREVNFRQ